MILEIIQLKSAIPTILYLLIAGIGYIIYYISKHRYNNLVKESNKTLEKFKSVSTKVTIIYTDIKVYSNSWKQEIEVGSGTDSRNEYIDIDANTLILKKNIDGIDYEYKSSINMKKDILHMKLAIQNEISFYYNPNNPSECYLDLSFLNSN